MKTTPTATKPTEIPRTWAYFTRDDFDNGRHCMACGKRIRGATPVFVTGERQNQFSLAYDDGAIGPLFIGSECRHELRRLQAGAE